MLLLKVPGQNEPSHLLACHSPGLTAASPQPQPPSSHGLLAFLRLSSSLVRHWSFDLGTSHVTQDDLILRSLMTSAKTLFLTEFTVTGSRGYDINILLLFFFWGGVDTIQPVI